MKKKTRILLISAAALVIVGAVLAVFFVVNSNLRGIEVSLKPFKTAYYVGETFEPRGLAVKAVYKSGEKEKLASDAYTVKSPKLDAAGDKTVTVQYKGRKATFVVTVSEAPTVTGLRLDTSHINKYFLKGTAYTKENSGLIVYESLSDGKERVSTAYSFSAVDTGSTGVKTVTVTYGSFTEKYDIEVVYGLHFVPVDPRSDETKFMYVNWNSDVWAPPNDSVYHRSADGNKAGDALNIGAYFTYYMDFGSPLSKAQLLAQVRYQTKIEVSFDNVAWQVIDTPLLSSTVQEKTFDLAGLLDGKDGHLDFSKNTGVFYVRFSDLTPEDGFGADLYDFNMVYDLRDPAAYREPTGYYSDSHEQAVKPGTDAEKDFLYAEEGSSVGNSDDKGQHRFNNAPDSFFTYGIDFGGTLKNLDVLIGMQGQIKLEASLDGKKWHTVCDYSKYQSYAQFSYSLAGTVPGFEKNTGKIYLRFSDSDNDGTFGSDVFDLLFKYTLTNDGAYKQPTGIPYKEDDGGGQNSAYRLEFSPYSDLEKKFLYAETGTHDMTDEAGHFRFIDGTDSFFTYGMDLGGKLKNAAIRLKAGQMFQKAEVSFDGKTWSTVLDKSDNKGVKTYTFNLADVSGFTANTGRVYVRFSGGKGYDGAFGIAVYNFRLDYDLAAGAAYKAPAAIPYTEPEPGQPGEHVLAFTPYTDTEKTFLLDEIGTNKMADDSGTFRFIDGDGGFFTYGMDFGGKLKFGSIQIKAGQVYQKAEISFDGKTWKSVLDTGSNSGVKTYTFDLAGVPGFAGNTGKVYVRFSAGKGYDGAFGITLYQFKLTYALADGVSYKEPAAITGGGEPENPGETKHSLSFAPSSGLEGTFLYADKGTHVGSDDAGAFRFIDGSGSYFTYGIDMGGRLSSGTLGLKLGQQYLRVDVSFDGEQWDTVLNKTSEGGVKNYSFDLMSVKGFAGNTGKVYVKLLGGDGYAGAFGTTLYQLSLSYVLADNGQYKEPVGITPPASSRDVVFKPGSDAENRFLVEDKNSKTGKDGDDDVRFIDGMGSSFTYGIDMGSPLATGTLELGIGQRFQRVDVSFDGKQWVTLLNTQADGSVANYAYEIAKVAGFASNSGKLYVRFAGGDGYEGGFGITLHDFAFSYMLQDDGRYTEPVSAPLPVITHTLSFPALSDVEKTFLVENKNSGEGQDGDSPIRFIDGEGSYFTYGVDAGSKLSAGTLSVKLGQLYLRADVSFDGMNWETVLNKTSEGGIKDFAFDLASVKGFSGNTGKVFVRFSGGDGYTGGFGTTLYQLALSYSLVDESGYKEPVSADVPARTFSLSFNAKTDDDAKFLYDEKNSKLSTDGEGDLRFIDGKGSFFTYGIDTGSALKDGKLVLKAGQIYRRIDVSFDGQSWLNLLNNSEGGGPQVYTFNLSGLDGFAGADGKVYVRFSGADGYDGGFGVTMYSLRLDYQLADPDAYIAPKAIAKAPQATHTLKFDAMSDAETTFLYGEKSTGSMSDGEGVFRFLDAKDAYFIYGVDAGSALGSGSVTVKIAQMYQRVDISFDGKSWSTVRNVSDGGGVGSYTFDLSGLNGFAGNTGKIYARFSGGDGFEGAFGTCLYSFQLDYQLADDSRYTDPVGIAPPAASSHDVAVLPGEEGAFLAREYRTSLWTDNLFRFLNGEDSYFIYSVDAGSPLANGTITAALGSKYQQVDVSLDGKAWQTVYTTSEGADHDWSYDLTTADGFAGNGGRVYVRFSGGKDYISENGTLLRRFGLSYTLADEGRYQDPVGAALPAAEERSRSFLPGSAG